MTVETLYNHPRVLYQTPDEEFGVSEPALSCSVDGNGLIVISQGGAAYIVLNRGSVRELCKLLRDMAAHA